MQDFHFRGLGVTLVIQIIAAIAAATCAADLPAQTNRPKLVVLDIELTGDLGGPQFTAAHEARLRMESDKLRQELGQSGLYTILDSAPAQALINKLKSQQRYLHDCNGCDLEIGRQLGADQVLVTWVDRVSGLILSLTYEFHSVATSQIVGRKSYDFRGDNDAAWTHAIKYMVRDLKETAATRAETSCKKWGKLIDEAPEIPLFELGKTEPKWTTREKAHVLLGRFPTTRGT
jgi:hypothetical protein